MSKSDPKSVIDPLDSIEKYGADALRIALVSGTGPGRIYASILKKWKAADALPTKSGMLEDTY
ncbi:MAG: hypothetical protein CM1200mP30_24470 [Pseudomonadota bacterium]|nr:MAG: hypothetical protein CM1200mP30_24470 [Pseudomonadota bacterium]